MAIPFLNHLDLRSVSELQNAILHKTTESSASNVEGKIIYDTGTNTLKYRSATAWISLTGQDANTFRTIQVDTNNDGSANETLGSTETLQLIGGSNITLAESGGVVTINGAAGTTVQINGGTARSGAITLQPGATTTGTIAVTEPNAAGIFNFDIVAGSIGTTELEDSGVTFAKIQDVATDTIVGRTANGTGVTKALSKSEVLGILNVADGAQANVATNLGKTTAAGQITITSSTGDNVIIGEATTSIAGLMSTTHHDKLDGIEAGATADQTASEIRSLVGSATDSNVFTDAEKSKLTGIPQVQITIRLVKLI